MKHKFIVNVVIEIKPGKDYKNLMNFVCDDLRQLKNEKECRMEPDATITPTVTHLVNNKVCEVIKVNERYKLEKYIGARKVEEYKLFENVFK